jgi:hypothetical protein
MAGLPDIDLPGSFADDPSIFMSDSDLEGYDWANEMQYLQRSSEHGSDGEIYIPEPTQQDEMKRVYLRDFK